MAKCVGELTFDYSGTSGTTTLPSGCAQTGSMDVIVASNGDNAGIGGTKGDFTLAIAIATTTGDDLNVAGTIGSSSSCAFKGNVKSGECLGINRWRWRRRRW